MRHLTLHLVAYSQLAHPFPFNGIYLLHLSGGGTRWYAPVILALDSGDCRSAYVVP